jgi:hypothetical protein
VGEEVRSYSEPLRARRRGLVARFLDFWRRLFGRRAAEDAAHTAPESA